MSSLQSLALSPEAVVAIAAALIGAVFGALVFHTNFCAMGGISDAVTFGDTRRLRSWLLAIATAVVATQGLQGLGIVDLRQSMYLGASLDWCGTLLGGLLFGVGMVFSGGCASKNLVRAGGGDMRALLVLLVLGVSAFIALGGLLGPARIELARLTAIDLSRFGLANQGLGLALARLTGLKAEAAHLVMGGALALALTAYCLKSAAFRASPRHVLAGLGVGLCVAAGWAVTGLAFDDLSAKPIAPQSLTFVRPSGDTLDWLMRFTAAPVPGFGVACVLGTIAGAFLAAKTTGRFRVATFADTDDTLRNLFGAVTMGIGGVMALGCTMGQAITGVSTLAVGSLLALAGILIGGVVGIKALERRMTGDWSI